MSNDNPFAPPSVTADAAAGHGVVFSEEGVRVVSSLASWMRGLSTFYFVGLGLLGLGLSCMVISPGPGTLKGVMAIAFLVVLLGLGALASWLRSAASGFERGVFSDDEMTLGQGFRSLRAYLILMGVFSLISLASTIFQATQAM